MSDASLPSDPPPVVPVKPFRTVGIVGAGASGATLAHWCALSGYGVILCDSSKEAIQRGVAMIRELFADRVKRGVLSGEEAHKLTGGIGISTSLEDFEICDLVIEAVTENLAAKQPVFAELSARVDPDCVLASNSATLALAEVAAKATGPDRIVRLRFADRIERQTILEVMPAPQTSRETLDRIMAFAKKLDQQPVVR